LKVPGAGWRYAQRSPGTVLGSLLGHGSELSLRVPLLVATAGYLVAIALALGTIRRRPHDAPDSG